MTKTVSIRSKKSIAGAGFNSSGTPVQGKKEVVGFVDVTSYSRGGESLVPSDVGLDTIDYIDLKLTEPFTGPNPAQGARRIDYSYSAQEFYVNLTLDGGSEDEVASAAAFSVRFAASGDSASNPEAL